MKVHAQFLLCAAVVPLLSASSAVAQTFAISLGVRETGSAGAVGTNGGTTGSIEWINLDALTLTADGSWQQLTFTFPGTVNAFVGNSVLDGTKGVLEHIRFRNSSGVADPITLYIDDVVNTVGGTPITIADFEGYTPKTPQNVITDEVMFRAPRNSGSTSAFLLSNDTANVTDEAANGGTQSYRMGFQFVNSTNTNWVRMTTFNTATLPNPIIDFTAGNQVSFWLRAVIGEPTERWIADADGSWDEPANWNNGTIASGIAKIANFLSAITDNRTVTLDSARTISAIRFKNAKQYTIGGSGSLTLTAASGLTSNISAEMGTHAVAIPITQQDRALQLNVDGAADVLTIAHPVTQALSAGSFTPYTYLGVSKSGAGKIVLPAMAMGTMTVNGTGTLEIAEGTGASRATFVSMQTSSGVVTGRLDLKDTTLVVDYDESAVVFNTQLNTLAGRVAYASNGGAWDRTGVTSSLAAAAAAGPDRTGIGIATAEDFGFITEFAGQLIDGNAVILRYTLQGDANLDLKVDTLDFNILAGNFEAGGTIRWSKGDFNYNGVVDSADFNRMVANYGKSLIVAAAASGVAVPEPAVLALAPVAALLLRRRR